MPLVQAHRKSACGAWAPLRAARRRGTARRETTMRAGWNAPDFDGGWRPECDAGYVEVGVLSFGPVERSGSSTLLTLLPVKGGATAFKMSVTLSQVDSIRMALSDKAAASAGPAQHGIPARPVTHDLFKQVMDMHSAFVTKAAITHIQRDVFIARVWMRSPVLGEFNLDARPSDAIALAIRCKAPLYLNTALLHQWGISVDAVKRDAEHGLCDCVQLSKQWKSTRAIVDEVRAAPEHIVLAKLKMELDLAVRLERFSEAAALRDRIRKLCPVDSLQSLLQRAVDEERYADAAELRDKIVLWKARVRRWENGGLDASLLRSKDAALGDLPESMWDAIWDGDALDALDSLGEEMQRGSEETEQNDTEKGPSSQNNRVGDDGDSATHA